MRLLFQHGQITAHDADLIAPIGRCSTPAAIWAFCLLQIVNRAYYALHDTMTPLVMSVVNIVLNLVVEIPLLWWLGEAGMAVGTLVSFAIQAVVMLWMLDRRVGGLGLAARASAGAEDARRDGGDGAGVLGRAAGAGLPARADRRVVAGAQLVLLMRSGAASISAGQCLLLGLGIMEQAFGKSTKNKARSTKEI